MSEMAQAFKLLGHLPKNCIQQHSTGTFGVVGQCNIELLYERKDGKPLTDKDIRQIASFGITCLPNIGTRVFETKKAIEEAIKVLEPDNE